jgi:MYXO-CTERM domain-containing protein
MSARKLLGLLVALVLLAIAPPAAARGSVKLDKTAVEEDEGRWKLKLTIDYGGVPDLAVVSMIMSFQQVVYYEQSLTDASGDRPVERQVPVNNATPINLPIDVDFADISGKVFKITKFDIKLTRDRDFEAGEYELTVKLANGGNLGNKIRIKLLGKNKAVDRRAMVFDGGSPNKGKTNEAPKPASDPGDGKPKAAEDYGPDLSDIPDSTAEATSEDGGSIDEPGKVPPKQGGCGCNLAPALPAYGWGAGSLALLFMLRRRRSSFRPPRAEEQPWDVGTEPSVVVFVRPFS